MARGSFVWAGGSGLEVLFLLFCFFLTSVAPAGKYSVWSTEGLSSTFGAGRYTLTKYSKKLSSLRLWSCLSNHLKRVSWTYCHLIVLSKCKCELDQIAINLEGDFSLEMCRLPPLAMIYFMIFLL
jgi:hypothetical protein